MEHKLEKSHQENNDAGSTRSGHKPILRKQNDCFIADEELYMVKGEPTTVHIPDGVEHIRVSALASFPPCLLACYFFNLGKYCTKKTMHCKPKLNI